MPNPPTIAPLLDRLQDVSPVFVQRFLEERSFVPGKGYSRQQTLDRLRSLSNDGSLPLPVLRDLVLDWHESGDKHVYLLALERKHGLEALKRCAALPPLGHLPPEVVARNPTLLYAVSGSERAKVVYGEIQTVLRPVAATLSWETEDVVRRTVIEIDVKQEFASVSIDPLRGASAGAQHSGYYSYYQNALLALAPEAKATVDLATAMAQLEQTELVRMNYTRAVDGDHATLQLSSQSELRDVASYAAVRGMILSREAARYRWIPGLSRVCGSEALQLYRELRSDVDAQVGLIRLPSQTTTNERRYVVSAIYEHS